MGENTGNARGGQARVIDFSKYRAERARQDLPLFARPSETPASPELSPSRPLRAREIAHRQRMLQFLRTTS
jgi:hypothetical protein